MEPTPGNIVGIVPLGIRRVRLRFAAVMAGGRYFDAIWSAVPEGAQPEDFAARRGFLLRHVAAGERVLDLGCGTGEFTAAQAQAGAQPVGVDISQEALRRARERHPDLDLRLAPATGPLPLDDAEMDAVWAGDVIEHVLDTGVWLSEVRRVLRPGGRLLLTTPYHGRLATILMGVRPGAFEAHFDPRSDHLRFYTAASLRELLLDFHFEDVTIRPAGGWPGLRRSLRAVARRGRW
ncbi:MAG TPA: class I SAM-dependent methyltransferase [Solirubrobacteraceae bacterium]|nr:class I SAM-dependent methyltransferase [Solirubrobacteraceae bacterium]